MRQQLTLTLFLLFTTLYSCFAQAPQITYYNKKGEEVSELADSYFYRIIAKDLESDLFKYIEFYSGSDVPKTIAYINRPNAIASQNGIYQTFHPNGKLYQKYRYNNKSQLIDTAYTYYPTGILQSIRYFPKPSENGNIVEKIGDKEDKSLFLLAQDSLGWRKS